VYLFLRFLVFHSLVLFTAQSSWYAAVLAEGDRNRL